MHRVLPATAWLLLAVVLTGCTPAPALTPARSEQAPTASQPPTPSPPPPILTQTKVSTPPPTLTPQRTSTLAAPTASPAPTLTAAERELFVREALGSGMPCKLPCWWGVVPGQTSWADAERLIRHLGAVTGPGSTQDNLTVHGTGGFDFEDQRIYNRIRFFERAGTVVGIDVYVEADHNAAGFQSVWQEYSPKRILMTYGQPARVWIRTAGQLPVDLSNPRVGYGLLLFYDHLGFLVEYSGVTEYKPVYHICPKFENGEDIASMKLSLQAPDSTTPLQSRIDGYALNRLYYHTLREAAGLEIEAFVALFTQGAQPACFDTPQNIWP